MKRFQLFAMPILMSICISAAHAQNLTKNQFVALAGGADMLEVQSSQLALERAQSPAIKEFAQIMIQDHKKAAADLAKASQADLANPGGSLNEDQEQEMKKLKAQAGGEFETAYVQMQVKAHGQALSLMKSYADNGDGAALREHAAKAVPMIQMHLERAKMLK